jgi:hypothetical protein
MSDWSFHQDRNCLLDTTQDWRFL